MITKNVLFKGTSVNSALILAGVFLLIAIPARAIDDWPGDSGAVIANAASLGAGYEPSGLAYHPTRNKLLMVGDDGDITTMKTDGSSVHTKSPTGEDLEGITVADQTSSIIYVGVENPDMIKEYNLDSEVYTGKQWTLTAWMTGDPNQGLEGLAFVPNGFHPYANSNSGGLFYAGLQQDGKIYVFDINTSVSESVTHVDTITVNPGKTDISGLDYNSETNMIYAIFDTADELVEMRPDKTVVKTYHLPGSTQEGIAVVTNCPATTAQVFIAEDGGPEVIAYGSYPVTCWEDDGDGGGDGGDGGGDDGQGTETRQDLSKNTIVTAPGPGGAAQLRTFTSAGQAKYTPGFYAYAKALSVGFNVATGDLNGDGQDEIITAPRQGGSPQVRIFDKNGQAIFTPGFYAYDRNSRCGVDLTTGDLNGDGRDEIVTIPGAGCNSHIKIFNYVGVPLFTLGFYAYAPSLTTGFRIAAGDLNDDGKDEIVTAPEKNSPAQIRIFNYVGEAKFVPGFYAYASNLKSGADVACADLNDDGKAEIITVPGEGFPAQVRIFNWLGKPVLNPGFYAYATSVKTGFDVTAGDLNNDHKAEIVVAPKQSGPAHIRVFDYLGQVKSTPGFYAYGRQLPLGADVAVGKF